MTDQRLVDLGRAEWDHLIDTFGLARCVRVEPTVEQLAHLGADIDRVARSLADLNRAYTARPQMVEHRPARTPIIPAGDTRRRPRTTSTDHAAALAARRTLRRVHDLTQAGHQVAACSLDPAAVARLVRAGLLEVAAGGRLHLTPAGHQAATAA